MDKQVAGKNSRLDRHMTYRYYGSMAHNLLGGADMGYPDQDRHRCGHLDDRDYDPNPLVLFLGRRAS